jgi:septal ring factor EnvC (AmiA/AmiB activator)
MAFQPAGPSLEQLLADGKLVSSVYEQLKEQEREFKEQEREFKEQEREFKEQERKIQAIKERLKDKDITDERRTKVQAALDALEIGI